MRSMWTLLPLIMGCAGSGTIPVKGAELDSSSGTFEVEPPTLPTVPTDTGPTAPLPTGALQFEGEQPKNLLWVSIDTLRKDVWSRYGGENHMPFLDGLMAEGVALDDVRQCSNWTGAGTSCTMSGRHGFEAGFEPLLSAIEGTDFVPDSTVFLAEVLAEAGWYTILLSGNGWLNRTWGNTQGYFIDQDVGGWRSDDIFTEGLEKTLAAPVGSRWFTHLHLYDPHAPYNPPEAYLGLLEGRPELPWNLANRGEHYDARDDWESLDAETQAEVEAQLRIRYQAELRMMDDMIEGAWQRWDAAGLLDDTLVVFWADHGEAFWEHGRQTHAWDLYSEENDVILFFWSKTLKTGSVDLPVSTIDLAPTILDLYDLPVPSEMTGIVLDDLPKERLRFSTANARSGVIQSVTSNTKRLQFYWETGRIVVTDSAVDATETEDLYNPDDPTTKELWAALLPRIKLAMAAIDQGRFPITWPEDLPR